MSANAIIEKIKQKSEEEIALMKNEANAKAEEIENNILDEANKKAKDILNSAKMQTEEYLKSENLKASLKARKDTLTIKRQVIDKVYAIALDKLNLVDDVKLANILKKTMLSYCMWGDVSVLISQKFFDRYMNIINSFKEDIELKLTQKHGIVTKLSFKKSDRDEMGLVFIGEDFDVDASFPNMIKSIKEQSEKQVTDILFKSEG